MDNKKVDMRRRVEQVRHDLEYKGIIAFDGVELSWTFTFDVVPLSRIDEEGPQGEKATIEKVRRFYVIEIVGASGKPAELTNDEYGFFLNLLFAPVVRFFNEPQAQAMNDPEARELQRTAAVFGVSVGNAMESTGTIELNPAVCEMLSQEKFGCNLVAEKTA